MKDLIFRVYEEARLANRQALDEKIVELANTHKWTYYGTLIIDDLTREIEVSPAPGQYQYFILNAKPTGGKPEFKFYEVIRKTA